MAAAERPASIFTARADPTRRAILARLALGKTPMPLNGACIEIEPPARIFHTELFEQDCTGGETRVTTEFAEVGAGR